MSRPLTPAQLRALPRIEFPERIRSEPGMEYLVGMFIQVVKSPKSHPDNALPLQPITPFCTGIPENQALAEEIMREKATLFYLTMQENRKNRQQIEENLEATLQQRHEIAEARKVKTPFKIREIRIFLRTEDPERGTRTEILHVFPGPPANPVDHQLFATLLGSMLEYLESQILEEIQEFTPTKVEMSDRREPGEAVH